MRRSAEDRFWAKVDVKVGDCWEWQGGRHIDGYGRFQIDGRQVFAHRFAYELMVGAIPVALELDHLCRNRQCVSPLHLELVTKGENVRRGIGPTAVNAQRTHCIRGHELSGANLRVKPNGQRNCVACHRQRGAARRSRRKLEVAA